MKLSPFQLYSLLFLCILPCIVGILVYSNTVTHGFVYDDVIFHEIGEFRHLSSIPLAFQLPYEAKNELNGIYRPLSISSLILNFALFGESPVSFHIVNIVLHGIICSLIYILLFSFFRIPRILSISVSLLFAVLPVHTEVVANIKSRDELLCSLFFLLAWMFFEKGTKHVRWYFLSTVLLLLALFSKENAFWFPAIIGLWAIVRNPSSIKNVLVRLLWFVPSYAVYFIFRIITPGTSVNLYQTVAYISNPLISESLFVRFFTGLSIIWVYIKTVFFPFSLSATYHYAAFTPILNPLSTSSWLYGLVIVSIFIRTCYTEIKKKQSIILGCIITGILYIPIHQVLRPVNDIIAERWMYLPSLGLLLITVSILYGLLQKHKRIFISIIIILCVVYGFRTIDRNSVWESNKTLYLSMVRDAPMSAKAHGALAREYVNEKDYMNARRHADIALSIYPNTISLQNVFAILSIAQENPSEALEYLQKSEDLGTSGETKRLMATAYYLLDDYEKAYEYSMSLIEGSVVHNFEEHFIYMATLAKLEEYDRAQHYINRLSSRDKKRSRSQYIQAVLLYKTGKIEESLQYVWDTNLTKDQRMLVLEDF